MGVILFEMLTGRLPFCASHRTGLFKLIVIGDFEFPQGLDPAAQVRKASLLNYKY